MINQAQIKRAFEQADDILKHDVSQKELDQMHHYAGLVLAFITAAQNQEVSNDLLGRMSQAVADGWMGADNLGRVER